MENLASAAICGVIYHLFSGQSLTIIGKIILKQTILLNIELFLGSTGPVLVFETIVFDICVSMNLQYLSFRFWVHIWTALILFIMVVTDASSLVIFNIIIKKIKKIIFIKHLKYSFILKIKIMFLIKKIFIYIF